MAVLFDPSRYFSVIGLSSELLVGAKLYWYVGGSTTPINTYADRGLTVANSNPVLADGVARFPQIWLADGTNYKWVLTASNGTPASPIITQDDYLTPPSAPSFDPDLTDFLTGAEPLPLANGGTGATSAVDALDVLGGMGLVGGAFTGDITRDTKGGYIVNANSGMAGGTVYLQAIGGSPPAGMVAGDWLAEY